MQALAGDPILPQNGSKGPLRESCQIPNNAPPTVPQSFITAVSALAWGGNHLVQSGTDAAQYPTVRGLNPGVWEVVTPPGLALSETTYLGLVGATANSDGSYTTAAGTTWSLRSVNGWATPSAT